MVPTEIGSGVPIVAPNFPLYRIDRRLTNPDGSLNEQAIELAAIDETRRLPWVQLANARKRWRAAALTEQWSCEDKTRRNAAYAEKQRAEAAEIERLVAAHTVEELHFEYQRRCFGSFEPGRRDLYHRAWTAACDRRAQRKGHAA